MSKASPLKLCHAQNAWRISARSLTHQATRSPLNLMKSILLPLLCIIGLLVTPDAWSCTRVLYSGTDNTIVTGRSMDWAQDMGTNLWLFPQGIERNGSAGPGSIRWTSKFGSVIASIYEAATVDGINEKGLVANVLYLVESDYGAPEGHPVLCISMWAQYVLDNFATVSEVVEALSKEPFRIVAPTLPNGSPAQGHLAISDPGGDSAIFEYVGGKLVIHHGREYTVMTNSPIYSEQLALNTYWQSIGGTVFLPGTNRASDRFARASFFVGAVPKKSDPNYITAVPDRSFNFQAIASVLSIMRSVSVPLGMTMPDQPNIASTIWRTAADQKNRIYYFDSATTPNTFWVNLDDLNFGKNAPIQRLEVAGGRVYSGDSAKFFTPQKAFTWLSGDPAAKK